MCGGGFVGDFFDSIGDVVEDIVDTSVDIGNEIFNASNELVFGTTATIFETVGMKDVGKTFRQIGDTLQKVESGMLVFAGSVIKNPSQLTKDPIKAITLAVAIVFAAPTMGASIAAWVALYSGAVTTLTSEMAKNGWIDSNTAMVLNVIGTVALAWVAGGGTAPVNSGYISAIQGLEALGVSSATANVIVGYAAEVSIFLSSTTGTVITGAYSIYQSVQNSMMLELQYKQALAAFEAWKKQFDKNTEREDGLLSDYITGRYYRYMAGQPLFNIGLASRERYVPTSVQSPNYGMFQVPLHTEDEYISKLMWEDKNYNMAGGAGFMNMQMQNIMLQFQ